MTGIALRWDQRWLHWHSSLQDSSNNTTVLNKLKVFIDGGLNTMKSEFDSRVVMFHKRLCTHWVGRTWVW